MGTLLESLSSSNNNLSVHALTLQSPLRPITTPISGSPLSLLEEKEAPLWQGKTPSQTNTVRITMGMADTNMFLAHAAARDSLTIPTKSTQSSSSSSSKSSSLSTLDLPLKAFDLFHSRAYRSRGTLGFTVDDNAESDAADISSSSSSASSSSLRASHHSVAGDQTWDASPWKHMDEDDLNMSDMDSMMMSSNLQWTSFSSWSTDTPSVFKNSQNSAVSMTGTQSIDQSSESTTLPWVPNQYHIEKLTVSQLKTALANRGLPRTGNKADLQQRLSQWSTLQRKNLPRQGGLSLSSLYRNYGVAKDASRARKAGPRPQPNTEEAADLDSFLSFDDPDMGPSLAADSLAEWSRTVDLEPLFRRREAIRREKIEGKPVDKRGKNSRKKKENDASLMTKDEYLSVLTKVFDDSSSSKYSNYEVKKIYAAAKEADQMGDRALSKRILNELKEATPHDGRVYRRLARLETEDGNIVAAKAILQEGIRVDPDNSFLWHGMAQIALSNEEAKRHYRKAIQVNPSLPMSYHALGTLEHNQGKIADAMKTLKQGLQYCPTNHRLHHALGDIYRDAKMLVMAEKHYRKALKHGPEVSHGFAYNALAFVSYEDGSAEKARYWLRKSTSAHNGRNANAWVSWAQMEEAEGNIDAARTICMAGIGKYERGLLKFAKAKTHNAPITYCSPDEPEAASIMRNRLMAKVPVYRSGDRFYNLYRNWVRLEERHGTMESVEEVYERAFLAFPTQWKLTMDWAQYYARLSMHERASELFLLASSQSKGRHGDPYRLHAEFEMSRGHFAEAQKVLFQGAVAVSQSAGATSGAANGMVGLYYVWAICEWHLGNIRRTEQLLDQALRIAPVGQEGATTRSAILHAMAKLQFDQDQPRLAQHCIGLCLKEHSMPGGKYCKVWDLWAAVAAKLNDAHLEAECKKLADEARLQESDNGQSLKDLLGSPRYRLDNMQHMMRRDPWHMKLFDGKHWASTFHFIKLPSGEEVQTSSV